jgi:hypothetical protein
MAQQTIGLGASANDSTGDPIRTAFGKVNANFTELYAADKIVLTNNVTLYARAGGLDDDTRSGLVNDDANAFATVGYAYDRAMVRYDAGGQWTINIEWDGTDITAGTPVNLYTSMTPASPYVNINMGGANLTASGTIGVYAFSLVFGYINITGIGSISAPFNSAVYAEGVGLYVEATEITASVNQPGFGHFQAVGPTTLLQIGGTPKITAGGASCVVANKGARVELSTSIDFDHNTVAFSNGVVRATSGGWVKTYSGGFFNVENVTGDKFFADQQSTIDITNFVGTPYPLSSLPGDSFGTVAGGSVVVGLPVDFTPSAVFADLPSLPVLGMRAVITDSTTATWGDTIAGSGGNTVLAWYNGANWTVTGK